MSTPLTAELVVELTLHLTGEYQDYVPECGPSFDSGGQPAEGGFCEDLAISAVTISLPFRDTEGNLKYREVNILEGVDTTSSAVQLLLSNLQAAVEDDAQEAMADALPDCDEAPERDYDE